MGARCSKSFFSIAARNFIGVIPTSYAASLARNPPALVSKAQNRAPEGGRLGPYGVVDVVGPYALYGTGASYTEVIAETDGEDDEGVQGDGDGDGETKAKKKKKKSGTDKQKVNKPAGQSARFR